MKRSVFLTMCVVVGLQVQAQTAYLQCDFSQGIPSAFSLHDLDAQEPSLEMAKLGFSIGTPWIAATEENGNMGAVSTSWYRKAGTSDDWLITSPFSVASPKAVFQFRAKAGDKDYRDGYSVYIAQAGSTPEEIKTLSPALTVKQEQPVWTNHEISLADYEGKEICIAIVNNTRDRSTLWIDDMFAGVPASLMIESGIQRITNTEGKLTASGTVKNITDSDISGYTITVAFGNEKPIERKYLKTVKAGQSVAFNISTDVELYRNSTMPYTLSVKAGEDVSSITGKITCLHRMIVAEEVTGTWCGYCVRGIAAMKYMKEAYLDTFLGIAVHHGTPGWSDPMDYTGYSEYLFSSLGMPGYPHVAVNRRQTQMGDPTKLPEFYDQILSRDLTAGVKLIVDDVDTQNHRASFHSETYFVNPNDDINYSLAYVLLENNVHKDAIIDTDGQPKRYNGYEQNNYYAGGSMGEMDGFENLPSKIPGPDMYYQDVARAFWGDGFEGFTSSLPTSVVGDSLYKHEYSVTLPENVLNYENTELAVLLINRRNGEIINADVVPLKTFFSAISTTEQDASIVIENSKYEVNVQAMTPLTSVEIYSIDGRLVESVNPADTQYKFSADGLRGMFIVKASNGHATATKRIIF